MKITSAILFLSAAAIPATVSAQTILLSDDFDDGTISGWNQTTNANGTDQSLVESGTTLSWSGGSNFNNVGIASQTAFDLNTYSEITIEWQLASANYDNSFRRIVFGAANENSGGFFDVFTGARAELTENNEIEFSSQDVLVGSALSTAPLNLSNGDDLNVILTLTATTFEFTFSSDGNTITSGIRNREAGAPTTVYAGFFNQRDSGGNASPALDSITVSTIPEPSTYAALIGVAALAGVCMRRKKSKAA